MTDRDPLVVPPRDVLRHDVRTELNHVVGYAELLVEELEGAAAMSLVPVLDNICGFARRAASAVNDVLDPSVAVTAKTELAGAIDAVWEQVAVLKQKASFLDDDAVALDVSRIETAAAGARRMVASLDNGAFRAAATPAGTPLAAAPVAAERAGLTANGQGDVVLVVDDDEENRDLLARRLEKLGYVVLVAEDGQQALGILEIEPVDLVLLDLMMPEMNGFQVLEYRDRDERLRDIPVVMISSESDTSRVARCIEMGADDYLPKPFEPVLLQARVGACLEKKRLRDKERDLLDQVKQQADQLASYNTELEERVRVQVDEISRLARLRRFLSPQVVDVVVSSGRDDLLRSHRREIAVLFCDLRGFTSFSEVAEPEEVMAVLHEFHDAIGALTHEFGATVGFFAGDGIMVFFNDPIPCPNPAEQALRMAVALRDGMVTMTRDWRRRGHDVGFGIGISFGYATLGEIGFEGRYDYGVIGSVVNLAARLCDQARHGQILISKRAHNAVEDLADSEEVGDLMLKGLHSPVTAFKVVGLKTTAAANPTA